MTSNTIVIDRSGEVRTGAIPLLMRDDAEEEIARRGKELETYLKCLETYPLNRTILKDKTVISQSGGEDCHAWWWDPKTKDAVMNFLLDKENHKVDGKKWSNGFLGSRWADTKLNGKMCRIAFYSRKSDPSMFTGGNARDYFILIDPDYFD